MLTRNSRLIVIFLSWLTIILPFGAQTIYGQFFCRYSLWVPLIPIFILTIPAAIWMVRKRYLAVIAASVGVLFWVVWENNIQCISEEGPFVGGLGPIYLFVFGLPTSVVLGVLFERVFRRFKIDLY